MMFLETNTLESERLTGSFYPVRAWANNKLKITPETPPLEAQYIEAYQEWLGDRALDAFDAAIARDLDGGQAITSPDRPLQESMPTDRPPRNNGYHVARDAYIPSRAPEVTQSAVPRPRAVPASLGHLSAAAASTIVDRYLPGDAPLIRVA